MSGRLCVAALTLLLPVFAPAADERTGWLCIAPVETGLDPACIDAHAGVVEITPAENDRSFVWMSPAHDEVIAGTVPAGAAEFDLHSRRAVIDLSVRGSADRGWPASVTVTLARGDGRQWTWTIPARAVDRWRRLGVETGTYDIEIGAARHFPSSRRAVRARPGTALRLGEIVLMPFPALRARVIGVDDQPLAGALMGDSEGKTLATADSLGVVEWEADGDLPATVRFSATDLSEVSVAVAQRKADADLGVVRLSRGGGLRVTFDRSAIGNERLEVRLVEYTQVRSGEKSGFGREVARGIVREDESELELLRLEPRRYALYVSGPSKLQRFSEFVAVEESAIKDHRVEIRPYELEATVYLGSRTFGGARVGIGKGTAPGPEFQESFVADEDGRFGGEAWARGRLLTNVSTPDGLAYLEGFHVGNESHHSLDIRVPTSRIRGRIYDQATGRPLAQFGFTHTWDGKSSHQMGRTTGDDGRFVIEAARIGRHAIIAGDHEYERQERIVEVSGFDEERTVELPLRKGGRLHLRVTFRDGRPAPSVGLFWLSLRAGQPSVTAQTMLQADGSYSLQIDRSAASPLWIAAEPGSFTAMEWSSAGADAERPLHVVIPDRGGPLEVESVSADSKPLPNVHLGLLYEGRLIPSQILHAIGRYHGVRFITGTDGRLLLATLPLGRFELWGRASQGDFLHAPIPRNRKPVTLWLTGPQAVRIVAD